MPQWLPLCPTDQAPREGELLETDVEGLPVCLARIHGELCALDNLCPHRQGPLGQGWIEGESVVCPWHSWAFNLHTGVADPPDRARVRVFPVRVEGDFILLDIE